MKKTLKTTKLGKNFYKRELLTVAKELLGKKIVKKEGNRILSGLIVETEAYDGKIDEAAHSFKGRTPRTEIMFNEGGYFYVYFTYGTHHCCNVVTGSEGHGTAVLLRAVEPVDGIDTMAFRRFGRRKITEKEKLNLTSGPGKLCQAFKIDRSFSGLDLTGEKISLVNGKNINEDEIGVSKRIGITRSVELPWRFFIKNNPFLSR